MTGILKKGVYLFLSQTTFAIEESSLTNKVHTAAFVLTQTI